MRMLKYFAVFVLLLIIASLNESEAAESLCGDWEPYKDSKCFKILDSTFRTFEDAEKSCNKLENSSTLPMIGSKEEQEFLANFLFKTHKKLENFWLGAKFSNNKFVWLDNTEVDFTNWDVKGEKNKTNYCIQMQAEESIAGKWIDEPCEKQNQVVCQKLPTWSMLRLQQTLLESRKEIEEMKNWKTLLDDARNHIKIIEQNPIPIGFIYVQLPSQPEPKILWPKVEWKDVTSEYAGLFFRAEGGNSTTFGNVQEASSPRLTQVKSNYNVVYKFNENSDMIQPGVWSNNMYAGNLNEGTSSSLSFLVSETEVRPRNKAVRIWKRTN